MAFSTIQSDSRRSDALLPPAAASASSRMWLYAGLALTAGVLAAFGAEKLRYETLTGYVQAETRTVVANRPGRISKFVVQTGELIEAGQPLVLLVDEQLQQELLAARQQVESHEAELSHLKAQAQVELAWRMKALDAEVFDTRLRSAQLMKEQLSHQVEDVAWEDLLQQPEDTRSAPAFEIAQPLVLKTGRTPVRLTAEERVRALLRREQAVNGAETVQTQLQLCEERLAQLLKLKEELPEQTESAAGVQVALARLTQAREKHARLEKEKDGLTLTSGIRGTVGVFPHKVGDHVTLDEPLVEILDEDRPYVWLPVPSSRIAAYAPGTALELVFPGGIRGTGRVREIPLQTSPLAGSREPFDGREVQVVVTVEQTGRLWPRMPYGSSVTAQRRR